MSLYVMEFTYRRRVWTAIFCADCIIEIYDPRGGAPVAAFDPVWTYCSRRLAGWRQTTTRKP
jgi:hypothetical protein